MCWKTKSIKHAMPKTAEFDIPVFKVVDRSRKPFYFTNKGIWTDREKTPTYTYEAGFTYRPKPGSFDYWTCLRYEIGEGIHSYSAGCQVKIDEEPIGTNAGRILKIYAQTDGSNQFPVWLDSYLCIDVLRMDCVIPKGSTYYLNEWSEYVSDRIRVTGFSKFTVG